MSEGADESWLNEVEDYANGADDLGIPYTIELSDPRVVLGICITLCGYAVMVFAAVMVGRKLTRTLRRMRDTT